ncbi:serine/threonine/tyrosine-interacting protein [Arapaima gigas]
MNRCHRSVAVEGQREKSERGLEVLRTVGQVNESAHLDVLSILSGPIAKQRDRQFAEVPPLAHRGPSKSVQTCYSEHQSADSVQKGPCHVTLGPQQHGGGARGAAPRAAGGPQLGVGFWFELEVTGPPVGAQPAVGAPWSTGPDWSSRRCPLLRKSSRPEGKVRLMQVTDVFQDWSYPMRREMQEIIPGLFLGPYSAAMKSKLPTLEKHGITHIICVRQDIEANFIKPNFPLKFRYLVLDIADNPMENIIRYFPVTKEFVDGSLQTGGKVLIHGNAGISRSAALVIAYLMETFGIKYREAFTYVQERRFCINPNVGFVHQMQEYEAIYQARLTIRMMSAVDVGRSRSLQAGRTGGLKRTLEEDEDFGGTAMALAQNG